MKTKYYFWIFIIVIISVCVLLVSVVPSVHSTSEKIWWDLKDASIYITSPKEKQFTPRADKFNDCQRDVAYLIPEVFTMELYKGSEQWYVVNASWNDGLKIPSRTFAFNTKILPDGTYYLQLDSLGDNLLSYTKNFYDSNTGSIIRTIHFTMNPTLQAIPESLELINNSKLLERELFSISSYEIISCEE